MLYTVDYSPRASYLPQMANRLLLTLLALMTGLAAQLSLGEARASQVASMQVAALREVPAANAMRAPAGLAHLPEPRQRGVGMQAYARLVAAPRSPVAPTVLAGIDRAHE